MKRFGKTSLNMWFKLYDDFLEQHDKKLYEVKAAEKAKAKKI